jgi:hypothetical protein
MMVEAEEQGCRFRMGAPCGSVVCRLSLWQLRRDRRGGSLVKVQTFSPRAIGAVDVLRHNRGCLQQLEFCLRDRDCSYYVLRGRYWTR